MKKKLALLFALITMLIVVGCGGSDESQPAYEMSDEYFALEIDDYVKLCETIPYETMFREIDTNQGARIKYIAKVDLVVKNSTEEPSEYVIDIIDTEANADNLDLAETLEYETNDLAYMFFIHDENVRLIEGDYIILYGEPWGTYPLEIDGITYDLPRLNIAKVQRFDN